MSRNILSTCLTHGQISTRSESLMCAIPRWTGVMAGLMIFSQSHGASTVALADLSIEALMNESVTSVSKKQTRLQDSTAAITIITSEDIMRLGITSIPEALRLAPGINVARMDASHWAISSRGFNYSYANKLLVLMDGRSLYTPAYGGVQWGVQDMLLEDLDRIEVVRGPGATLWGANAVNGVINITSKSAKDTQGWLFSTAHGNQERALTGIRYGGEINPQLHYRAYLKYFDRDEFTETSGRGAGDDWDSIRGGFRMDWQASERDLVTLQGDYYSVETREDVTYPVFTPPFSINERLANTSDGGNLLGRWTRTYSDESHLSVQTYFDHARGASGTNRESRQTADIEFEHRFALGTRNDIVWGGGYRHTSDRFNSSPVASWSPASRDLELYHLFAQNEFSLIPDILSFTFGSKFDHNDYTGWEIQPGARMLWTPHDNHSVWASASHAVSTPSRVLREGRYNVGIGQAGPGGPLIQTSLFGNDGVVSEELDAFELGYRTEATPQISFETSVFYNRYDKVSGVTGITPGAPIFETDPVPHLVVPLEFGNEISGHTHGGSITMTWRPTEDWRLTASYSYLNMQLKPDSGLGEGSPQQQAGLRSYLDLPWNLQLNGALFFVDQIAPLQFDNTRVSIPSYLRADLGVVWQATPSMEVGLWGYNLLDGGHPEFTSPTSKRITEVPRSIMGKMTWRF